MAAVLWFWTSFEPVHNIYFVYFKKRYNNICLQFEMIPSYKSNFIIIAWLAALLCFWTAFEPVQHILSSFKKNLNLFSLHQSNCSNQFTITHSKIYTRTTFEPFRSISTCQQTPNITLKYCKFIFAVFLRWIEYWTVKISQNPNLNRSWTGST